MKTKSIRNISDEDPDNPWYPPNYDYVKERWPVVSRKMWKDLENRYKTGIRNYRIQNINSQGRFGIWQDWNKIPQETREQFGLYQVGHAYKNDFMIYRQYIRAANSNAIELENGADIINPAERNKIYGITNSWQSTYKRGEGYVYEKTELLPNGGTQAYEIIQIRPPAMNREDQYRWNGYTITYDDGETYQRATATVSPVCRTIKSRRV